MVKLSVWKDVGAMTEHHARQAEDFKSKIPSQNKTIKKIVFVRLLN